MIDAGGGGLMQPPRLVLAQAARGELFTSPHSSIGTDPGFGRAARQACRASTPRRAEGGVWVLKDLGSTNGTYVNDKRVEKHELVDNDFVKFGGSLVKFKSL
jgi:hypothetical protein